MEPDERKLLLMQDPFKNAVELFYYSKLKTLMYQDRYGRHTINEDNLEDIENIIKLFNKGYIGVSNYGLLFGNFYNSKSAETRRSRVLEAYLKNETM